MQIFEKWLKMTKIEPKNAELLIEKEEETQGSSHRSSLFHGLHFHGQQFSIIHAL